MEVYTTQIIVVSILFVAALVRAAVGFGDALVAMPLLILVIDLRVATPLVAIAGLTIAVAILFSQWKNFNLKGIGQLIVFTLLGIPFGLALIRFTPQHVAKTILGILLILYGVYGISGFPLPHLKDERLAGVFGLIAGILGGGYDTNGPPIVIYGTLRKWSQDYFRINLQGYFFLANCLIVISHGLAGLWTTEILQLYLMSLPLLGSGILLGSFIGNRISKSTFEKLIYIFLFFIGILFLFE
ncbi:sulfite exporter TauE/SafE family protein [Leptothermofonsia sichuanensis E412]|uniref:sulfite exporter TauE/SafE family protein n=1 Tax=Leptothermofonsia sichuanensis TaxID=2917832 RepID=UPI001CA60691|nr:sulfite exporter TauE/SafE family protein [Leptothermofonsia sichuanensis]QZZ21750.1 sulfite exporter TauE/SafE family protein [Leptothermofonsia sichuanensis E412]